jgi:hypothetical protein
MKRVTVEVKGIISLMLDDDENVKDVLTNATLVNVKRSSVIDSHEVSEEALDWAVYYNPSYGVLLQMVLGSGSNISDEDGQYINGVFVTYDQDIVGSTYRISDKLGKELLEGKHEVDGACDGELTIDGESIDVEAADSESEQDYETQWVGYQKQMGNIGHRECLAGYLNIIGYSGDFVDDWKLVAKG